MELKVLVEKHRQKIAFLSPFQRPVGVMLTGFLVVKDSSHSLSLQAIISHPKLLSYHPIHWPTRPPFRPG